MEESGSKGKAGPQPQQIPAIQERKAAAGTQCGSLLVHNKVQPLEGMHGLSIGFTPGILSGKLFPRLCWVRALRDAHSSSLLWGNLPGWWTDLCCAYQLFIFVGNCNCCFPWHFASSTDNQPGNDICSWRLLGCSLAKICHVTLHNCRPLWKIRVMRNLSREE